MPWHERGVVNDLVKIALIPLPWRVKRWLLEHLLGYRLDPSSYIGLSWVYPAGQLTMKAGARIGHGNVCRALDTIVLDEAATVGNWNWITGRSTGKPTVYFRGESSRRSELFVGAHAAITRAHYLDCTNVITVGRYATVAGTRSTLVTHEIDIERGEQRSQGISIGEFCYVGTGCILLPGAVIPNRCVIAAGCVVRATLKEECAVYGGVPARWIRPLPADARYFTRVRGVVE